MKLSDEQREYQELVLAANQKISEGYVELGRLKKNCKHVCQEACCQSICLICMENFGWYCKDNPNPEKCCVFDEYGYCKYCGDPEERK